MSLRRDGVVEYRSLMPVECTGEDDELELERLNVEDVVIVEMSHRIECDCHEMGRDLSWMIG